MFPYGRLKARFQIGLSIPVFVLAASWLALGRKEEVKKDPLPVIDQKLAGDFLSSIKLNHRTPEDYILSKFRDHSIVFVGEHHRIRHDVRLIQKMIPLLSEAGIHNLGIEFGVRRDQARVDKLINAPEYDEQAARDIMFDFASSWGYQEYMDIYRTAWEVNRRLAPGAPRFRVVNLNAATDWSFVKSGGDRENPELMKKVFTEGDFDQVMAETIIREFVDKGQKALIYSGIHHAFTRYKQPIFLEGKFIRFIEDRMGNLVHQKLGDKVFTIYLHAPWPDKNYGRYHYPAGGVIDAFFAKEPALWPVGFDLEGTPFGELKGPGSIYEEGYDAFTLEMFADGYIFTMPLSQYQGVTVDERFVTEANFKRAVEQVSNFEYKCRVTGPRMFIDGMKKDADIPRRFSQYY